ncbi:MAG TPA: efflux RND transporter periplasmic adaptor subunit [Gammaproteobacteria bacterium]|nr:efflux RND transporter periplasmic adaptor subunit [Gammaproteobacteria bacterium]
MAWRALILLLFSPFVVAQPAAEPLSVYQVVPQDVAVHAIYDGKIEAINRATVSAQTRGRIQEIGFDVDDYVNKDDVLVRMQDKEQRARVDSARAGLTEAEARLAQAEQDYTRTRDVYKKKLVARSKLDSATAERNASKSRVQAARAKLTEAQQQLEYTVVRAPYSGIVVKRHVEVGEIADIGKELMTGLSLEKLRVTVQVPQSRIAAIRDTCEAVIRVPGNQNQELKAQCTTVFPYADADSNSFRVRLNLPDGDHKLLPGMLVKAVFVVGHAQRLLVPTKALVYRSEVTAVYVVGKKDQVTMRQVRTGERYQQQTEIVAGLHGGERIALDPIVASMVLKKQHASKQ